jgi:hypothetical protein
MSSALELIKSLVLGQRCINLRQAIVKLLQVKEQNNAIMIILYYTEPMSNTGITLFPL